MHKVRRYLSPQWTVADLGCGADAGVLRSLRGSIAMGYGLDREVAPHREEGLQCIPCDLSGAVRLPRASVDAVLILAVLEHCPDDAAVVAEAYRILRPGGVLLVTVPTARAQRILEWLARAEIVDPTNIAEHHRTYTHASLKALLTPGAVEVDVHGWQLGCNLFGWARARWA